MIGPARVGAATAPERLAAIGVGSCVAIVLYDAAARVGGLAHVMLPAAHLGRRDDDGASFPQSALPLLIEQMIALGAHPGRMTARLVGGASMFAALHPPGTIRMGERNLVATRHALSAQGIPVTAEATGGVHGRAVVLHTEDGRLEVTSRESGVTTL